MLKQTDEGVDTVLQHIRETINSVCSYNDTWGLANLLSRSGDDEARQGFQFCRSYVTAVHMIQLPLAQRQYPEEYDIPASLPSPTASTENGCRCESNLDWELPTLGDAFEVMLKQLPAGSDDSSSVDDAVTGLLTPHLSPVGLDDMLELFASPEE